MQKDYKRLGDYIREVDVRNDGLKVTNLLGLTINKEFIRSVANTVGTDMEKYKIIRKNQFACSTMQVRRDGKMPIALLKEDKAIISQAYPVFEIINENKLLPEFLMMWFTRSEFDREACFHAVGGVRGSIEWEDFLNMQLPIPSIEKQQEIVNEYHAVQRCINLNNQLIQKLEETAQAIYKQWFMDFEFPNEEGKPYKSSGGEMVDSELGEIPKGWRVERLEIACEKIYGFPFDSNKFTNDPYNNTPLIRIRDILNGFSEIFTSEIVESKYILQNGDLLIGMDGTFHMSIWYNKKAYLNQRVVRFRPLINELSNLQVLYSIKQQITDLEKNIQGTTVAHLSDQHIKKISIVIGDCQIQNLITPFFLELTQSMMIKKQEIQILTKLQSFLLSKLVTIEN